MEIVEPGKFVYGGGYEKGRRPRRGGCIEKGTTGTTGAKHLEKGVPLPASQADRRSVEFPAEDLDPDDLEDL